ncbi:MAG: VTT domain-containing protein [Thermoflexales bacterium]|nr:VTT domain-containing protein [Thermoflexales bacterium]
MDTPLTLSPPPPTWRLRLVQVMTLVVLIAATAAAFYFRDRIQQFQSYGYVAIFIVGLLSNATLILPLPGLAITPVMGAVFNPIAVGVVAGFGQAVGELTGYMTGYSGQGLIKDGARYQVMAAWMRRYGAWIIFILAAIPNPVFDVAGMVAGALCMPVWQYLLAATAGKVLKNIVFAYLGYWGGEWLAPQT